jgi:hypothetical protein
MNTIPGLICKKRSCCLLKSHGTETKRQQTFLKSWRILIVSKKTDFNETHQLISKTGVLLTSSYCVV